MRNLRAGCRDTKVTVSVGETERVRSARVLGPRGTKVMRSERGGVLMF